MKNVSLKKIMETTFFAIVAAIVLSAVPLSILSATIGCSAHSKPIFEFEMRGEATRTVSPEGSAYPGEQWISQDVAVHNKSRRAVFVHGYNLDYIFVNVYTKNPVDNSWVSRDLGYCGTGAKINKLASGAEFVVRVDLPVEIAEREFKIEFDLYDSVGKRHGEPVSSPALKMLQF